MSKPQTLIGAARKHALWSVRLKISLERTHGHDDRRVYFVQSETGIIKIGMSAAPDSRLKQLQKGRNDKLTLLADCEGGFRKEQALHKEFADCRIEKSEWFEPNERLWAKIHELTGYERQIIA